MKTIIADLLTDTSTGDDTADAVVSTHVLKLLTTQRIRVSTQICTVMCRFVKALYNDLAKYRAC